MRMNDVVICWFRQDLRLSDNPALTAACERGRVLPVYILDDVNAGEFAMGGASRWWLHRSLESLGRSLKGALRIYRGDASGVLLGLAECLGVRGVYWNRCYEPWRIERDARIKERLGAAGVEARSFNGSLLWEPWTVCKGDGAPYWVFTPYYRRGCLGKEPPRAPLPAPGGLECFTDGGSGQAGGTAGGAAGPGGEPAGGKPAGPERSAGGLEPGEPAGGKPAGPERPAGGLEPGQPAGGAAGPGGPGQTAEGLGPRESELPGGLEPEKSGLPAAELEPGEPGRLRQTAGGLELGGLGLPAEEGWAEKIASHWVVGEEGARRRLEAFIEEGLGHYKGGRDLPDKPYVSRMSPHLHFGEISPNQLWYAVRGMGDDEHIDHYCSELGWREFSYYQLYHHPDLPRVNLQAKFNRYPWRDNAEALEAWKRGRTGIPLVDAGMRELWRTGYMHNRVRMVVASFLVKNLGIHWHRGEEWFRDTLVDADLASNSAGWQWVAGCGADAAPFFRIFNPVLQGRKFDPEGRYIRRFVPEIASLPAKHLFDPWNAPREVLDEAGIELGVTYPRPLIDLGESRRAALAAYSGLRGE